MMAGELLSGPRRTTAKKDLSSQVHAAVVAKSSQSNGSRATGHRKGTDEHQQKKLAEVDGGGGAGLALAGLGFSASKVQAATGAPEAHGREAVHDRL